MLLLAIMVSAFFSGVFVNAIIELALHAFRWVSSRLERWLYDD